MKRRREGSLRSRAWSSLSHRLLLKAAPKVQNDLWVSREAARKKSALVPGGKGRQAGLSAGQIWYGMVCRKVCLSNAPARHPVRGRFLRASRIEANGSSRLERTPALLKKEVCTRCGMGERTDAAPGPGESDAVPLPQITSQKALPPAVVKNKNMWVSPVQGAPGIVSAVSRAKLGTDLRSGI